MVERRKDERTGGPGRLPLWARLLLLYFSALAAAVLLAVLILRWRAALAG